MDSADVLIWGVILGSIGLGFLVYGKQQKAGVPLAAGVALIVLPYLMPNLYLMLLVGAALIALPYFVRI